MIDREIKKAIMVARRTHATLTAANREIRNRLPSVSIEEPSLPIKTVLASLDEQITNVNVNLDDLIRPLLLDVAKMLEDGRLTADEFINAVNCVRLDVALQDVDKFGPSHGDFSNDE